VDTSSFSRRHAVGFLAVGAIDLLAVVVAGKLFGFSVGDVLLLKVDAAGLFVIGGYGFLLIGLYLLFKKDPDVGPGNT
jgi:preprotein translocase subunit Sss1